MRNPDARRTAQAVQEFLVTSQQRIASGSLDQSRFHRQFQVFHALQAAVGIQGTALLAHLLADCLYPPVCFQSFEVMSAPAHRLALRDDDSRGGADDDLLAGMARLLFRVVTFALLFVLWLTLGLLHPVNDKGQCRSSFFELCKGTDALASPLLLLAGEREDFIFLDCAACPSGAVTR